MSTADRAANTRTTTKALEIAGAADTLSEDVPPSDDLIAITIQPSKYGDNIEPVAQTRAEVLRFITTHTIEENKDFTKAVIGGRFKPREECTPKISKDKFGNERETYRTDDNMAEMYVLQLDFDSGERTFDEVQARADELGYSYGIYTTFSHTLEKPKMRVVFSLIAPVDVSTKEKAEFYRRGYLAFAETFGGEFDKTCRNPARILYKASSPKVRKHLWRSHVELGRPHLDLNKIIAELPPVEKRAPQQREGTPEDTSADREVFNRVFMPFRKTFRAAGFMLDHAENAEDNGTKVTYTCPRKHRTPNKEGDTCAVAWDPEFAEHETATAKCSHNTCEDDTPADQVYLIYKAAQLKPQDLRDYIGDGEAVKRFDDIIASLPPTEAELAALLEDLEKLKATTEARDVARETLAESADALKGAEKTFERAKREFDNAADNEKRKAAAVDRASKPEGKQRAEDALDRAREDVDAAKKARNEAEDALQAATDAHDDATESYDALQTDADKVEGARSDALSKAVGRIAAMVPGEQRSRAVERLSVLSGRGVSALEKRVREQSKAISEAAAKAAPRRGHVADAATLADYNRRYCLTRVGRSDEVVEKAQKPGDEHAFLKPDAFKLERKPDGDAANDWFEWEGRDHRKKVDFKPYARASVDPCGSDALNMFTGLALEGVEGDWSLWRKHLFFDFCHENPLWFAFLVSWLADIVQDPANKKGSAVIAQSAAKGTGKSFLGEVVVPGMLGRYASAPITSPEQVVGKFNATLAEKLFVFLEETFWAGDKAKNNAFKSLITSKRINLERKGVDPVPVESFARFYLATNNDWAIATDGTDERRKFLLRLREEHAKVRAYWQPIIAEMVDGDGCAAMLHDLERLHIPAFIDLFDPPQTPWLAEQARHSMPVTALWLQQLIEDEAITLAPAKGETLGDQKPINPATDDGGPMQAAERAAGLDAITTREAYAAFAHFARQRQFRPVTDAELGTYLHTFNVARVRRRVSGGREYCYTFPALEALRAAFLARYGDAGAAATLGEAGLAKHGQGGLSDTDLTTLDAWALWGRGEGDLPC